MFGRPDPQFYRHFSAVPPGQRSPSACRTWSGATPYCQRLPSRCLHKKICLHIQARMYLFRSTSSVVPSPDHPPLCRIFRLVLMTVVPPGAPATSDSQWRTTESTTTFKMVGDSVSPCVKPLFQKNGST